MENRISISSVINNQLPNYVKEEYPLVSEFLSEYYNAIENKGNILDILQNIDKYVKVDNLTNLIDSTTLTSNISFFDKNIIVSSTVGFPDNYGLIQIDNEIILYKSKTETSFIDCARGFSGISEYTNNELIFEDTKIEEHNSSSIVRNLSILFLKYFFNKVKKQITPGFENRELSSFINERLFLKQSKDFYSSKGTPDSFEILFRALYGVDVDVILPRDFLIQSSDAQYKITKDLVVESIEGNPLDLKNLTLYQDSVYGFREARGTITEVEKIIRGDKEYYVISLDYKYDNQINETGSIYGEFSIHPSTRNIVEIKSESDTITVDSTVSFPESGILIVKLPNKTQLTISYTSKSVNQFYGCSGINQDIPKNSELNLDIYAYGYSDIFKTNKIKVKITGVLSDLIIDNPTKYYAKGDIVKIKTLGKESKDFKANNWLFNIPTYHNVKEIEELDSENYKYRIDLYDNHLFYIGDSITVIPPLNQPASEVNTIITNIRNSNSFIVFAEKKLDSLTPYQIRKNIVNVNSSNYSFLNKYSANIQNVYVSGDSIFVASHSFPSYLNEPLVIKDKKIIFSGTFQGTELRIPNHKLYTGDCIVYTSESGLNLLPGKYFVRRIDANTIKLSRSRDDIFNENYIEIFGTVVNDVFYYEKFTYLNLTPKQVQSQKLLREVKTTHEFSKLLETPSGYTGIFLNGVELLNYKSDDYVYYGNLEKINVLSGGFGYDVINPPKISIIDSVGFGATAYCSVNGSLERIEVIDGGVNYLETPKINIYGGNGFGAVAKANLTSYDYYVSFTATQSAGYVNLHNNIIGFSSYHKLNDGEEVIYQTNGQKGIGGITTNSSYYVSIVDSYNIKLHKSEKDAFVGINTINLDFPYGEGTHTFKSKNKKRRIQSVTVLNPGSEYKNRKISIEPIGINTANNTINILNHGFNEKDIIIYESNGEPVSGLSTEKLYYVSIVNENSFRLAEQYTEDTKRVVDFYYNTSQFVDLTSIGTGIHIFKDEPIRIEVSGSIGISTLSDTTISDFSASLQPIFRGEIESVFLANGGKNYGSEEILNYNRQPEFILDSGSGAQLRPVIVNGSIEEVIVLNYGNGYNSPPNILIESSTGFGAILTPIIKDGLLLEVKVISGGTGYLQSNTSITVLSAGLNAKLNSTIKSWNINLVERVFVNDDIVNDDGIIGKALQEKYGLQYSHAYAPRNLRKSLYSIKYQGDDILYVPDLVFQQGKETLSESHSPIIGWAYDGNPIYGPYGYTSKTGGTTRLMKSGYQISIKDNRPSLDLYPEGFFVEDYEYKGDGDLDECNGRYCVTPDYPNGTYAYFATISDFVDNTGKFANYRKPVFPYIIGNYYKSSINKFNFSPLSNQDNININENRWLRNTTPYYLRSENSFYEFVNNPNRIKEQNSQVTSIKNGKINSIEIVNSGNNYSFGDSLVFDNTNTNGRGVKAYVSSLEGENITSIEVKNIEINNVEIGNNVGISTEVLPIQNGDYVTLQGKYPNEFSNTQRVNLIQNNITLNVGIDSTFNTGISTYLNVYSPIRASVNDLFYLGEELVKIIEIDSIKSRVRILRNQKGTEGTSSFSAGYSLIESPTKFSCNTSGIGITITDTREIYFNPIESVGIGTTSGIGIGTTLYFSNPGVSGTSIFIPTKTIHIPNHNIFTGTKILYKTNGGSSIVASTDGINNFNLSDIEILYVTKISNDLIGISTTFVDYDNTGNVVGVGTTNIGELLYFTGIGTNTYHSFKINSDKIVNADITKYTVKVSTASSHGLRIGDTITMNASPQISTSISVIYNDYNRRYCINPRNFDSSDIDILSNSIQIKNHNLKTGQSIIYREVTPVGGLVDNKIYYVISYGKNLIKLSESLYKLSNQEVVEITSIGSGTISAINPQIISVKNNPIKFDLSDSSLAFSNNSVFYSAFDFNIYKDSNFIHKFDRTEKSELFSVVKNGRIGIDTNASVIVTVNDNDLQQLYYRLEPKNIDNIPKEKKQVIYDDEIIGSSQILFQNNILSGNFSISDVESKSFEYNILSEPENLYYSSNDGLFEYEKYSGTGKIKNVFIENGGLKYTSVPSIESILSLNGSDALMYSDGTGIGEVNKTEILDIGFSYSSDYTLRPTAKLPDILKLYSLSVLESVGISSIGVNYTIAPDLIVIDGKTKLPILDVDLSYEIGDTEVKINKNVSGIYDINPTLIPINNSNGIPIKSIRYNSETKLVTIFLKPDYSNLEDFPFFIGEKVLVEGVSTFNGEKGFNSREYDYSLFTIIDIDPNIGGSNGSITYSMSEYLLDNQELGRIKTYGFVTPQSYFPIFDIKLKKLDFYEGESVLTSNKKTGYIQLWDKKNNNLKVATNYDFSIGEVIRGESSGASGVVEKVYSSDASYNVNSYSIVRKGWSTETGFLNNDLQRIHDNDYYQYFSYSLKSEISIDKWDNSVQSLNHTSGFKKFGDLVIKSNPGFIGLSTNQDKSKFIGIADFYSVKNVHCFDDFDLVYENYNIINEKEYSDEIIFNSRILQDYIESIGNKVLKIDDISSQFNSLPRSTKFSVIDKFNIDECRSKKYIISISDVTSGTKCFNGKQTIIVTLTHDGVFGYLNQYARVETNRDLGYFDFRVDGTEAQLLFYPLKYRFNNYDLRFLSFGIKDQIDNTKVYSLGNIANIESHTSTIQSGELTTKIVEISPNFRTTKLLIQVGSSKKTYYEFTEINIINNGNDVYFTEYGEITSGNYVAYSADNIGTYYLYLDENGIGVDFNLNDEKEEDYYINSISVSLSDESYVGIGSTTIGGSLLQSKYTSISSSSSPIENKVYEHDLYYNSSYYIVSVTDLTNNRHQLSEIIVTTSDLQSHIVEYGVIETEIPLGQFNSVVDDDKVNLMFTPLENISCEVRVFAINISPEKLDGNIDFFNSIIESGYGYYEGTEVKVKTNFNLTHNSLPIFQQVFDGSSTNIVSIENDTIYVPGHNFVTGEEIVYSYDEQPIGIATTSVLGIGVTNKLPNKLYAVKIDALKIKLSETAHDSLLPIPKTFDIETVGIGKTHVFTSKKQNSKSLITLDNVIQSPIVETKIITTLEKDVDICDEFISVTGITSFSSGDIIKINEEIMKIEAIESNELTGRKVFHIVRPRMGTEVSNHLSGTVVTKLKGDYNIVNNTLSFVSPPHGNIPKENLEKFDEVDYSGLSTSSTFTGRIFLRSGIEGSSNETYHKNYIFDDISEQFDGISDAFKITSSFNNIAGISTSNAIVLINEIFQLPSRFGAVEIEGGYDLVENNESTLISFNENNQYLINDINSSKLPRGGIILSVGSTGGFGYQPLVCAGGTAIISNFGTVQSISIGNSGSGYRKGYQIVNVGVGTSSVYGNNVQNIGIAEIEDGHIVGVNITNFGSGYSKLNPPYVFFDAPLSYTNIPLIYHDSINSGLGTEALVDIEVGMGSSVINFEFKNYGYKYLPNDILTIPTNGIIGIPTYKDSNFKEFQIYIENIFIDKFSGWSLGDLQVLDPIDELFDNSRTSFPILINGEQVSIKARPGSNIDVEQTLLIFINDVLQVPGEGYRFKGGSVIKFSEPPKVGDTIKILFYRGTSDVDTLFVDILETIKPGDFLTINSDDLNYQQNKRLAKEISSVDIVKTNNYAGPGISSDSSKLRPLTWCKQLYDTIIDGKQVTKDRIQYEPYIYPVTNIIKNVSIASSEIFVESVKTFFDSADEYFQDGTNENPQKSILIISQDEPISASATAVISQDGGISSIIVTESGNGYIDSPAVKISSPIGIGTTFATANAKVSDGKVVEIEVTYPGYGYSHFNPPQILIEPPKFNHEKIDNVDYEGDFGIIVGIETTIIGTGITALNVSLFIPENSFLKNSEITNPIIQTSGLSTDYYFVINNSNIGNGIISLNNDGSILSIGTSFIDNVYQVYHSEIVRNEITESIVIFEPVVYDSPTMIEDSIIVTVEDDGIITISDYTELRVTTLVENITDLEDIDPSQPYYGDYSWGRIKVDTRKNPKEFNFYPNGIAGILTSASIRRFNRLKYSNYNS